MGVKCTSSAGGTQRTEYTSNSFYNNTSHPRTYFAWARFDEATDSGKVIGHNDTDGKDLWGLGPGGAKIQYYHRDNVWGAVYDDTDYITGRWYAIGVRMFSSSVHYLNIYDPIADRRYQVYYSDDRSPDDVNKIVIGNRNSGSGYNQGLNGSVAHAAMWDVYLSQQEMEGLQDGASPLSLANIPRFYAPLDNSWRDVIENDYGTTSGAWTITDSPQVTRPTYYTIIPTVGGAPAPTAKAGTSTVSAEADGVVDALFSASSRTSTVAASSVGAVSDLFSVSQVAGTLDAAVTGALNSLAVVLANQPGTLDVSVAGALNSLAVVLANQPGTLDAAAIGAVSDLLGASTVAGSVGVAVDGAVTNMFGDVQASSSLGVASVGSLSDLSVVIATQAGTVDVSVDGAVSSLIVTLSTTGTISTTVVGSLNELYVTLDTLSASSSIAAVGVVVDLLNQLPTSNADVNVTVGGGGEGIVPSAATVATGKRIFYGFGFGHGN